MPPWLSVHLTTHLNDGFLDVSPRPKGLIFATKNGMVPKVGLANDETGMDQNSHKIPAYSSFVDVDAQFSKMVLRFKWTKTTIISWWNY